jgi:RNA polymerase sigma-70 factor (ECF subfamily)
MVAPQTTRADDAALIQRWAAGGSPAWSEVLGRFRPLVYSRALNVVRNAEDAEEITQDTFLSAHRALGRFRGDCSIHTWLCTIATRRALNRYHYWRRRQRDTSVPLDAPVSLDGGTFAEIIPDPAPGVVDQAAVGDSVCAIARAIECLSDSDRELILDRAGGASYEDMAERRQVPAGTIKSRLARAREKITDNLIT